MALSDNWLIAWLMLDLFEEMAQKIPSCKEKANLIDGLMAMRRSMVQMQNSTNRGEVMRC